MSTETPNQRAHDQLAPHYDSRWRHYVQRTVGRARAAIGPVEGQRILDLPTGTGALPRQLHSAPGTFVVGADLSLGMLRQAAAKQPPPAGRWVQASAASLPFTGQSFDWVVSINSFHCFRQPQQALAEMHRVLRPGGKLLLMDWCDDYLTCKLCGLWLRRTDPTVFRMYTSAVCRHLLEQAGFAVQSTERFRVGWLWGMMMFTAIRPPSP